MGWYLGELVGREHGVVGRARADVLGAEQVIRERVVRVVRPLLPLELVDRVVHLQWSRGRRARRGTVMRGPCGVVLARASPLSSLLSRVVGGGSTATAV